VWLQGFFNSSRQGHPPLQSMPQGRGKATKGEAQTAGGKSLMLKHEQIIEGKPQVKQRPRMTRFGHVFTPKETLDAEERIVEQYDGPEFEGPVEIAAHFYKNHTEVTIKQVERVGRPSTRGDIDNLEKLLLDGLQKAGAIINDRQVVTLRLYKK
jgi:Holliday junction resolvase RusA-like endonuclease